MVQRWYNRFDEGDYSCKDFKRSGRPNNITDDQLEAFVQEQPGATAADIANGLGISTTTVYSRMEKMGYSLKMARWVPYNLKQEHKDKRVTASRQNLARFEKNLQDLK